MCIFQFVLKYFDLFDMIISDPVFSVLVSTCSLSAYRSVIDFCVGIKDILI